MIILVLMWYGIRRVNGKSDSHVVDVTAVGEAVLGKGGAGIFVSAAFVE